MKDFNDFEFFAMGNIHKVAYDASRTLTGDFSPALENYAEEIAQISSSVAISFLRQYHEWLYSEE